MNWGCGCLRGVPFIVRCLLARCNSRSRQERQNAFDEELDDLDGRLDGLAAQMKVLGDTDEDRESLKTKVEARSLGFDGVCVFMLALASELVAPALTPPVSVFGHGDSRD